MLRRKKRKTKIVNADLKIMKKVLSGILSLLIICSFKSTDGLKEQYEKVTGKDLKGNSGTVLLQIAQEFKGIPYVAHTLENESGEQLVCRFDAFDCTTLVENLVALTRSVQSGYSFEQFQDELTRVRYRNGVVDGYGSRLHYFTDWAHENEKRGVLEDITKKCGGVKMDKPIHFMTSKKELYKGITSDAILSELKDAETAVSNRERYFIPVAKISSVEHMLKDGDIVGITSTIEGLDCNHQGIVKKIKDRAYLYHASSKEMKVVLSEQTLAAYVGSSKRNSGIIVLRLKEPKS